MAAAISFVFRNAAELEISINNYSVWGASAGAKMAVNIGSNGIQAYGGDNVNKPSVIIIQYQGLSDDTKNGLPTFAVVGERDGISVKMEEKINNLMNKGIEKEFHKYRFTLSTGES